ncbi:hypothetical protein [Actinokineospora sp.]|uniref:hypothetical protein n=1 Tax=Actinokineospora sp. TaxID=1872133 RepID=UPI004037F8E1
MDYRITAAERARFKRCRRQWDFASPHRRDLEPVDSAAVSLPLAIKDALAVYYYPGTWDWHRELVLSLVHKAFLRSVREQSDPPDAGVVEVGTAFLANYSAWAPTVDDFAPVKIDHDVEGLLPDPRDPLAGLVTPDGRRMIYATRVDLLAVDAADEYWVVRHQVVEDWQDVDMLLLDEAAVAACWAWEQVYLGMEIAGTIHNELRTDPTPPPGPLENADRVAQHEPSGGGRAIPQHRRLYARAKQADMDRVVRRTAGPVRRTRIRRGRIEIAAAGAQLGAEALDMADVDLVAYPAPAPHCRTCRFRPPCLAMMDGADPEMLLSKGFRPRPPTLRPKPRLGQSTWGFGRGAAPPPEW